VHEINHSVLYKPANTEQILRRKPARCWPVNYSFSNSTERLTRR
jgi:hypothetical protein